MKSTPENCASSIRLMALPPPPPSPMTLIFAAWGTSSSSNSGRRTRSFSIKQSPCWSENLSEEGRQPAAQTTECTLLDGVDRGGPGQRTLGAVEREAHARGVDRATCRFHEAANDGRRAATHWLTEDPLGQLWQALHDRRAPGHHETGRGGILEAAAHETARHQGEDLLHPRLEDSGQHLPR